MYILKKNYIAQNITVNTQNFIQYYVQEKYLKKKTYTLR